MNIQLLIVDPQKDFCIADEKIKLPDGTEVSTGKQGKLVVPGADEDMARLTSMVERVGPKLDEIHVTLDSHQTIGIERPKWWKRTSDGAEPDPFTCLGIHPNGNRIVKWIPGDGPDKNQFGMVPTDEEYTTYMPTFLHNGGPTGKGVFGYLEALAAKGRYPHIVWTEHCIIGTWGWGIVPELSDALCKWEREQFASVNYVVKGNNPWTEHFSGVMAEVPDPKDPSTQVNTGLVQIVETADIVVLGGEALSHCVANTGRDIGDAFSDPKFIEKLMLLTDASSNVANFDFLGTAFIQEMVAKGMKTTTTIEFLA